MSQVPQSYENRSATTAAAANATSVGEISLLFVLMLTVAAVTFAVHRPVLDAQAISFDDNETFIESPLIQTLSWASVKRFFTEVKESSVVRGYYRPLTFTSLMLDWARGGSATNFRPFHQTSLALHIGSTLLVMLLCYQIFGRPTVAAMVGLLFGLHPLTVEPIAWVMERKTILAAFFAFACLCSYVRYAHCGRWRWFVFAVLLYLLSLLAKPTSTPLPFMLLLMDCWPLRRFRSSTMPPASFTPSCPTHPLARILLEKIPFLVLAVLFGIIAYLCENKVTPLKVPIAEFPLRASWLVVFYLGKLVMPIHLSSVYMLPAPLKLTNPAVLASVVGTIAIVAALVASRRWTPALWVGAAIFFIALSPTMGIVHYSWVIASDKYVYLPAIGLVLTLTWLLTSAWIPGGWFRRLCILVLVIAAASAMARGTRRYLPQWKTSETLNTYMYQLAPNSPVMNYQMGSLLRDKATANPDAPPDQTLLDQAFDYYKRASELPSRVPFASPHYGMGWIFAIRDRNDEAIEEYNLALVANKDFAKAYVALAKAYVKKNQPDKAIDAIRQLIATRPMIPVGHQMLAGLLISQGKVAEAVDDLTQTVANNPSNAELALNLADAYIRLRKPADAVPRFEQSLALNPNSAPAHYRLASALMQVGRPKDAVGHYAEALRLAPTSSPPIPVMNDLAWTLATNNLQPPAGTPSAIELAEKVCQETKRKGPVFLDTLAAAYARAGRYEDAARVADEAIELATANNQLPLVRAMDARRHLYRANQPYNENVAAGSAPAAGTP